MEEVIIGKIICSFKVDGAFKVSSSTSFASERFKVGNTLLIGEERKEYKIQDSSINNELILLNVEGITSKEEADALKGKFIYAQKDESLLKKNEYYYSDIVGCKVVNQDGVIVGEVIAVEEFPAQITLRIKGDKKEAIFIPFIDEFIISVNIKEKVINVMTIGGMI